MHDFLSTMGLPLITCIALALILGYPGIHIIKREVIFIDIAVAQIAALGAIFAHMAVHTHLDSPTAAAWSFGATLPTALFFAVVRRRVQAIPIEAVIGITYAAAAAGALFIIGRHSEHTHLQQMLTGNLLWISPHNTVWSLAAFALAGIGFAVCHHRFRIISDSYTNADKSGMNIVLWDFLFYALCGIVITVAVRIAGVAVVFAFLIIPAAAAALLTESRISRIAVAWLTGISGAVAGLLFCSRFDFSAGTSVSLWLLILLVIVSIFKYITRPPANSEQTPPKL